MNPALPAGLTPELLQAILAWAKSQPAGRPKKVVGVLRPDQIRGHLGLGYEYREFPKMLQPPPEEVTSIVEEKRFRARHDIKLKFRMMQTKRSLGYHDSEKEYWELQAYPKMMKPKQVKVYTPDEEGQIMAAWHAHVSRPHAGSYADGRGKWFFHPSEESRMVFSLEQEQALSPEWKPTILEAFAAAQDAMKGHSAPSPSRKGKRPSGEAQEAA